MTGIGPEARRHRERARQEGVWRYLTIQEAASPALSGRQRGAVVRRIVAETTTDGIGNPGRVAATVERWLRAYRSGGVGADVPGRGGRLPRPDPRPAQQPVHRLGRAALPAQRALPGRVTPLERMAPLILANEEVLGGLGEQDPEDPDMAARARQLERALFDAQERLARCTEELDASR